MSSTAEEHGMAGSEELREAWHRAAHECAKLARGFVDTEPPPLAHRASMREALERYDAAEAEYLARGQNVTM